nr:RecName: Full=Pregnancy-associated glycoprotein 50C; AltName: Full=EbPAG-C 50 kDa [Bison bonasus]
SQISLRGSNLTI